MSSSPILSGPKALLDLVEAQEGSVVSRVLLKKPTGTVTLFAFGEGQGLSEHTAPFDALVQVLEGTVQIKVGEESHTVQGGEALLMPAHVPHALDAVTDFKMVLVMVREP